MSRLVKILEVKAVVPDLVECCPRRGSLAYLELNHEHKVIDDSYRVNASAQTRDVVFEIDVTAALKRAQAALQQIHFFEPRIPLRELDRESRCPGYE